MSTTDAATTVRGRDDGECAVFRLRCEWSAGTTTSAHSHAGWEVVLVASGELRCVLDGERAAVTSGRFLELPAGSVHAIWAAGEAVFDVIGQQA